MNCDTCKRPMRTMKTDSGGCYVCDHCDGMTDLTRKTREELVAEHERLGAVVGSAFAAQKQVSYELRARDFGIRVGEWVNVDGKDFQVVEMESYWPVLAPLKADGQLSMNRRHAYNWKAFRAGERKDPW